MDNKELSEIVGAELRERGYDGFRMLYLEHPSDVAGVGIEVHDGDVMYRNAWKTWRNVSTAQIADRVAEWMDKVRAAPEKYRAA